MEKVTAKKCFTQLKQNQKIPENYQIINIRSPSSFLLCAQLFTFLTSSVCVCVCV